MKESCFLWISELPPNVTHQSLIGTFSRFGCLLTTKIHEAGNLRGAVLSFIDTRTAAKAYATSHLLNGQSFISEYCDQSGEPGLQRLKDLANRKFCEKGKDGGNQEGKLTVLKVWNFPDRSPDSNIQDGLYHEYKQVGKVASIQVRGEKDDRHALIVFKRAEDAETAYELTKNGKSFLGMTLNVERLEAPSEPNQKQDEFHIHASRTLLVSHLNADVSEANLREALGACGTILDIELRPQADGLSQAVVQFADLRGAAAALRRPDGVTVAGKKARLSYGRSQPTNCVWLANLSKTVTEPLLSKTFACHGRLRDVCVNSHRLCALVFFDEVEDARRAVDAMKGGSLAGQRILVDFASQPCQKHFVGELVTSGQCSSNYKLFEQFFAPELHRGIIPSPKAAARYREMMLEYMKARNGQSRRKVRDCRVEDTNHAQEPTPSNPAEPGPLVASRRRSSGGSDVRRKSGHSSDGDVSTAAKDEQECEQRLLARLSGFEDARSECSEADTTGSLNEHAGVASDCDRLAAFVWPPSWQGKKSRSPISLRSPASAPTSSQRTPVSSEAAADINPVSPQGTGPSASDARCLEQAVSAYEAALGAHVPLIGGLFDCASPIDTESENHPGGGAGDEEARSSSIMPTPPETSVSPTPPLPNSRAGAVKRHHPSGSECGESTDPISRKFERRRVDAAIIKREPDRVFAEDSAVIDFNQPYESMYDKIKRRQASRTASASDSGRLARSFEIRRSEEVHQTSKKKPPARPSAASRQHSTADPRSASDTENETIPLDSGSQAATPLRSKKVGCGRRSTISSDACGVPDRHMRVSLAASIKPLKPSKRKVRKPGKLVRGKMSVDSVFGSSSDSEEVLAPATPSTIPMTDSSRGESLADPSSPPAGSRLTDIFAEAKAQLDPRAVTEKSLFSFSDDETFQPAPDLPTIDRFQPDAATLSPDRPEDAEPPKLAAAHAEEETAAAHALAQLSQRPPHINLAQPQFRVPELTLRPLIPAPPAPALPQPQSQPNLQPQPQLQLPQQPQAQITTQPHIQQARMPAPDAPFILHPLSQHTQSVRPPMQPAAQQDLEQFVQDVIRKVQAAPPNQTTSWDSTQLSIESSIIPTCNIGISESQQPTISLTGGLTQRPVKRSPPAMEALALQHVDEIIQDVVEGRIDLLPYMERGHLRCPSDERFALTPVPLSTTPVRPPSASQSSLLSLPPSQSSTQPLTQSIHQQQPIPVTTAPELRLQPLAICPVSTSAGAAIDSSTPTLGHPPLSSIAMASLSTSLTTTDSVCDPAYPQRMQQQQQSQQQQVQLQALYMHLLSSRYPQDLLYNPYVPQLQLFQSTPGPAPQAPPPSQQPPPPPLPPTVSTQPAQAPAQSSQLDTLLRKYPVKWQGRLALKNDEAGVQMHFVRGSDSLAKAALELAAPDAARMLKVAQRMRLEPAQLEGVQRKMADEAEYCVLLAVACGVNAHDYRRQTHNLREAFIKYLQDKQAAGIVNVNYPGQEVPAYVVHIFPPGLFATSKLQQYAIDLYASLFPQPNSETPHLLVVVTTV